MERSKKTRRAAKVFLWIGIIALLVTAYAAFLHFGVAAENARFEMKNPDMQKFVDSYSLECLLISAGVTLILFCIALICAGVAHKQAKRENEALYQAADEYYVEPSLEVSVSIPAGEAKKAAKSIKEIKDLIVEKAKDEKVQKVGKVVVPLALGCIVTAAIATTVGNNTKAKRRRQFYKWLG